MKVSRTMFFVFCLGGGDGNGSRVAIRRIIRKKNIVVENSIIQKDPYVT